MAKKKLNSELHSNLLFITLICLSPGSITVKTVSCETSILTANTGTHFSHKCSNSGNIISSHLPNWLVYTASDDTLEGVPLQSDVGDFTIPHLNLLIKVSPPKDPLTQFQQFLLTISSSPQNNSNKIENPVLGQNKSSINSLRCYRRWPTVAALVLDFELGKSRARQRVDLMRKLKQFVPTDNLTTFHLVHDANSFSKNLFILASGPGNEQGGRRTPGTVVIWQIGCGSISSSHLKRLEWLEKTAVTGQLSQALGFPIDIWFVADHLDVAINQKRFKRQVGGGNAASADNIGYFGQKMLYDQNPSSAMEGSGGKYTDGFTYFGSGERPPTNSNKPPESNPKPPLTNPDTPRNPGPMPKLRNVLRLSNITVYHIMNYVIPNNTFYDREDGYTPNLILRLYTTEQRQITSQRTNWISFDAGLRRIRLYPTREHIGMHNFTLCAYDRGQNQVCTNLIFGVEVPKPIILSNNAHAKCGTVWKSQIQKTSFTNTDQSSSYLTITAEGNSPFHWDNDRNLKVLTECKESKMISIKFTSKDRKERKVQLTYNIQVQGLDRQEMISSPLYRIRLRYRGYTFRDVIKTFDTIVSILKNAPVSRKQFLRRNLKIMRFIKIRQFPNESNDPEELLEFTWVYEPDNLSCDQVKLQNVISSLNIQRNYFSPFMFEEVSQSDIGKCSRNPKPPVITAPTITTTTEPVLDLGNIISNFTVELGQAFWHGFTLDAQFKDAVNDVRLHYNSDSEPVKADFWVQIFPKPQPYGERMLYGLATEEQYIAKPHSFVLTIVLTRGPARKIPFSISVVRMRDRAMNDNHKVALTLPGYSREKILALPLRWNVVSALDKYLRPDCEPRCGQDILLKRIEKSGPDLNVEWSQISLMKQRTQNYPHCPGKALKKLYRLLQLKLVDSYEPNPGLVKRLEDEGLGRIISLTLEKRGDCQNYLVDGDKVVEDMVIYKGYPARKEIFPEKLFPNQNFNVELCDENGNVLPSFHSWINISLDRKSIYCLTLNRDSFSGDQRFRLKVSATNQETKLLPLKIDIRSLDSNDKIINHNVTMRIETNVTRIDRVLDTLELRKKLVDTLDEYLGDCGTSCGLGIAILGLNSARDKPREFIVEWSQISLLGSKFSSPYMKTSRKKRSYRFEVCPKQEIQALTRKLIGDQGTGPEPMPQLKSILMRNQVGRVLKVKVHMMGDCDTPSDGGSGNIDKSVNRVAKPEDNQRTFLITTVVPACGLIILALVVALIVAYCLRAAPSHGWCSNRCGRLGLKEEVGAQQFQNKNEVDERASQPSKPLILPNEKPPLPPPEYCDEDRVPMTSVTSPLNSTPVGTLTRGQTNFMDVPLGTLNHSHGRMVPNAYRNPPPHMTMINDGVRSGYSSPVPTATGYGRPQTTPKSRVHYPMP